MTVSGAVTKIDIKNLSIWFGDTQPIKNLSIKIYANEILSIIGPANSGKTSFLRTLNCMNDLEPRQVLAQLVPLLSGRG